MLYLGSGLTVWILRVIGLIGISELILVFVLGIRAVRFLLFLAFT